MKIRSPMSFIMGLIGPEHKELFSLNKKNAIFHFNTLASTNMHQSAPNLVKIDMTIGSQLD